MVDAVAGIILVRFSEPLSPETVALAFQGFPVINWETPILSHARIHIGRSAGDQIKAETASPRPDIGGILVHQDRDIAHQGNALLGQVFGGRAELACRAHLKPCPEAQLSSESSVPP